MDVTIFGPDLDPTGEIEEGLVSTLESFRGGRMIARIWHGEVAPEEADEYLDYLNRTGVPDYRATEGNRGVYVLRRLDEDRAHFLTVSFWESMQKIEGFAGADPEKARYYPEDERFLLHFEPAVGHYEVVVGP